LQLPSVWSDEASVLAQQGVQEGSGTCNFFSNGYYGQVMCTWTGLVALGAGLRHNEAGWSKGIVATATNACSVVRVAGWGACARGGVRGT